MPTESKPIIDIYLPDMKEKTEYEIGYNRGKDEGANYAAKQIIEWLSKQGHSDQLHWIYEIDLGDWLALKNLVKEK